jgi:hypothetical protein
MKQTRDLNPHGFVIAVLLLVAVPGCRTADEFSGRVAASRYTPERIILSADQHGFVHELSGQPFQPWGLNYGHGGRLMEDFWENDWSTFARDFQEMKALGANVVRLHLQFGKFMSSPTQPNAASLERLAKTLRLAESCGLYLDVTGLACYRAADVPAWYNQLDEAARWRVQAFFWEAVAETCAGHPSVFCYDLVNEPVSPGSKRDPGKWSSGVPFGGYDFVQFIALDPAGRDREEIAVDWIDRMSAAIRKHDASALITVGLLPWSPQWQHLSGFVPAKIAPHLDFISVHLYPDSKKPGEAFEALKRTVVGKPVVIEETFPLACTTAELEQFLRASRSFASGWIGHYDGKSLRELHREETAGRISPSDDLYRQWLALFVQLRSSMASSSPADNKAAAG